MLLLTYRPTMLSFSLSFSVSLLVRLARGLWCDFSRLWPIVLALAEFMKRPWGSQAVPATSGSWSKQLGRIPTGPAQLNRVLDASLVLNATLDWGFSEVCLSEGCYWGSCVHSGWHELGWGGFEVDGYSFRRASVWCELSFGEMFVWCDIAACSSACGGCEGWLRARHRRTLLDKRNMLPATSPVWSQLCVSYLILEPKGRITPCIKKSW